MKSQRILIKWFLIGALSGYFLLHPLVHLISLFHFFSGSSVPVNIVSGIIQAYSASMLPWSLAFMILNGLMGLFWGKIKLADEEKKKIIAQLQKPTEPDDEGNDPNSDKSMESEPGLEFLDGMSTGTARFIIDREVDPGVLEKYNIKEL